MKKRVLKWLGRTAAVFLVLALVVIGALATSPGQRLALGLVSYVASDADSRLEIGELEGSLFGAGRIDRVVMRDREGPWLEVRDIRFAWRPSQLFAGLIAVDRLEVGLVRMARQPVAPKVAAKKSDGGGPTLVPVTAKHVEVGELVIDEPVMGRAVRLRVTASADLADASRALAAQLVVARLDEPDARISAQMAYQAKTDALDIRIAGSEPADGLVAHLLDFPERPPLAVTFSGSGPRHRWRGEWALSASGNPFAAGVAAVDRVEDGHKIETRFEGYLGHVVPAALTGILDGKTVGALSAFWAGKERVELHEVSVASEALEFSARGALDLERNDLHGSAAVRLARKDGAPVRIPVGTEIDQAVTIDRLAVDLSVPDAPERVVRLDAKVDGVVGAFGSMARAQLSTTAAQKHALGASAFDVETIETVARIDGLKPPGDSAGEATTAHLRMSGHAKSGTLTIASLSAEAAGATLSVSGTLNGGGFNGSAELKAADLSRFAAMASRPLAGALVVQAKGDVSLGQGDTELVIEAAGRDLKSGIDAADRLLAGTARLKAQVARSPAGALAIDDLVFKTDVMDADARAFMGPEELEIDAWIGVRDLSKIADALSGAVSLKLEASGSRDDLVSKVALSGEGVSVHGAKLTGLAVSFDGRGAMDAHAGTLQVGGALDGQPIKGGGAIAYGGESGLVLDKVALQVASAKIAASIRVPREGAPKGDVRVAAPRLGDLAPLAGVSLSGSADAEIAFSDVDGVPVVSARAQSTAVRVDAMNVRGLSVQAKVVDYLRSVRVDGKVRLAAVESAQVNIRDLQVDAQSAGEGTTFKAAALINEFQAALSGAVAQRDSMYAVNLAAASLRKEGLSAELDKRASVTIDDGTVRLERLVIRTDGGRTEIAGRIAPEKIDLAVTIKRLPAGLANAFDRTLGLEGAIDGTIKVAGTTAAPKADAALTWSGASAGVLRAQSLPALTIEARARLADDTVSGEVEAGGVAGLSIKATGKTGLAERAPVSARVTGTIPLRLANGVLGARAASASGTAQLAADVGGVLSAPRVAGTVRIEEATLNDPSSGLKLVGITGNATFTQAGVTIETLQGRSTRGGTFAARGKLAQGGDGAMAADLTLDVAGLKFDDQQLMSGELDADLAVSGPLTGLFARGTVGLKRLDVIVPSQMPQSITSLDIKHVNAPADSRAGRESAEAETQSSPPVRGRLDVRLNAADRIFVRGRGLDAQLGGGLHIQETTDTPVVNGGFSMQRGRLTIVGRQLDFKHGRIFFNGSLEPQLDMKASADADGYTVSVLITGPASKPSFKFTSDPPLPEDEAMARLLFNKSLAKLSPVQLAQLASEIDKIGGLSSGPSTLDKLKSSVGVDVLDVSTEGDNGPTVSAGSYINENTYVGVRQGTSASSSRVVIDHDFTSALKARGELGADGDSKIGVGVEWDY